MAVSGKGLLLRQAAICRHFWHSPLRERYEAAMARPASASEAPSAAPGLLMSASRAQQFFLAGMAAMMACIIGPHAMAHVSTLPLMRQAPGVPAPAVPGVWIPVSAEGSVTLGGMPEPPFLLAQAGPSPALPSLVLPPAATTDPPMFASLMQMGDSAMVRGDITRARALYERAAVIHPASSAALIAAGKTYDPNILRLFGGTSGLADVARARAWYERARALGDASAENLLASLR